VGRKELERDEPVERGIPGLLHHAHAAFAELFENLVVGNRLADHVDCFLVNLNGYLVPMGMITG
jgi:hypothetical protein